MYLVPEMMNIGLGDRQWPNDDYKEVASVIALCNPNVRDAETLTQVIDAVLQVPEEEIRTVTAEQLVKKYKMPRVF